MSWPVYTKRLLAGDFKVGAGASVLVPANRVWVVECLTAIPEVNTAAAAVVSAAGTNFWGRSYAASASIVSEVWNGRVALVAGEALACTVFAGGFYITVTGFELSA